MEDGEDTPNDEATQSNSCILQAWESAAAEQGTSIAPSSAASRRSAKRRSSGIFKASDDAQDGQGMAEQVVDASSPESLTADGASAPDAQGAVEGVHGGETAGEDDDSFLSSDDEALQLTGTEDAPVAAAEEADATAAPAADLRAGSDDDDDMDTRMSLDPTEAANLLMKGRRKSMAPGSRRRSSIAPSGGAKRPAEAPLATAAPGSAASSKRSRRSSVSTAGGLAVRSPRVLSRARDSISSVATPDMAALLSDPLLAEGEDEITFAGTPAHKLSAKQLRRAAALSSASKASRRRSSLGGDHTEDLGSLVDLLHETGTLDDTAASARSARSRGSAASAKSRAGSDDGQGEDDDMDTRMSLDPAAAARVAAELAAAAPGTDRKAPSPVQEGESEHEDDDEEHGSDEHDDSDVTEDEEGEGSPTASSDDTAFHAAQAEEEALLLEAGITPTHRPASRGARTSADRISVAASVRAEHARAAGDIASPEAADEVDSPLAPPTALTFDSDGDDAAASPQRQSVSPATSLARYYASRPSRGSHGKRQAASPAQSTTSPGGTAGSSVETPSGTQETASAARESVSPAAPASPQRAAWTQALLAPGIVKSERVMTAMHLPLQPTPFDQVQDGSLEQLPHDSELPVHWALTTTSAQQRQGIVSVSVPSVVDSIAGRVQALADTAAGKGSPAAATAAQAALASIAARVLLPHARAMQWATSELQKQVVVSSGEIATKMAEMSARNPALFRQFKSAAVRGGTAAEAARLSMQALYLQQGTTAAVRFQDWKLKMTSALAAAFEKGMKQASTASEQLATLTDKCAAAAHDVNSESQAALQQAADAALQQETAQAVEQLNQQAAEADKNTEAVQAQNTAAAVRVADLKQQLQQLTAQVDAQEQEAAEADAAAAAVDDISPEQALAATAVARARLECAAALSGWSLADATTAAGDTVLRSLVHTSVGKVLLPLGTVTVRSPPGAASDATSGATVSFVAAPASSEPRTQAQREALTLASYLVHDALAFSVSRTSANCSLHSLLAAVHRGTSTGAAAACDLVQLSLRHKVEVQRGTPLPRSMEPAGAVVGATPSSVSVTLTHRQQRGKVVLTMQLQHGQHSGSATAQWRIGGSVAAKAALQDACAAAGGNVAWMSSFVQAVDEMNFAA